MLFTALSKSNRIHVIIDRLYHTETGCTLVSMLFGVALAFMFQKVCKGDQCIKHLPPPQKDIDGILFEIPEDGCYTYVHKVVECPH